MPADTRPLAAGVTRLGEALRARLAVDGVEPRYVGSPDSAGEAARILAWARDEQLAVIPRGGGTRSGVGNIPRGFDLSLTTQRLAQLIEHEPADLTVTVEAGMPFAELQGMLRRGGQFLPLDPPLTAGSTIGGVVAANASGPFRLRYGTARDLVIGTQLAGTDGRVSRAGGKVVKNVTGYDLNKLYVGSLGTLALITELTFKVQPIPEEEGTLLLRFRDYGSAARTVYRVLRSPLTPSAMEISRILVDGAAEVGLHVHVGGFRKPLERSILDLRRFGGEEGAHAAQELDPASARVAWESLRAGPNAMEDGALLKIAVPVSQLVWAAEEADAIAASNGLYAQVQASAGVGIVRLALNDRASGGGPFVETRQTIAASATDGLESGDPVTRLTTAIRRMRGVTREHLGTLVVERAPRGVKAALDVFGDAGDSAEISRRIKAALDPAGIMSPGRFVGRP